MKKRQFSEEQIIKILQEAEQSGKRFGLVRSMASPNRPSTLAQ